MEFKPVCFVWFLKFLYFLSPGIKPGLLIEQKFLVPSYKHQSWQTKQIRTILEDYWAVHRITGQAGGLPWSIPYRGCASSYHKLIQGGTATTATSRSSRCCADITVTDVLTAVTMTPKGVPYNPCFSARLNSQSFSPWFTHCLLLCILHALLHLVLIGTLWMCTHIVFNFQTRSLGSDRVSDLPRITKPVGGRAT